MRATDRDVIPGGGFAVVPDELRHAAHQITGTADTAADALRRCDEKLGGARYPRLPAWLVEADQRWRHRSHGLLGALRDDARNLAATAEAYTDVDRYVSMLAWTVETGGRWRGGTTITGMDPRGCPAPTAAASHPVDADVVQGWSDRAAAAQTVAVVLDGDVVAVRGWSGRAATAYTQLLTPRVEAWQELHADAARVGAILRRELDDAAANGHRSDVAARLETLGAVLPGPGDRVRGPEGVISVSGVPAVAPTSSPAMAGAAVSGAPVHRVSDPIAPNRGEVMPDDDPSEAPNSPASPRVSSVLPPLPASGVATSGGYGDAAAPDRGSPVLVSVGAAQFLTATAAAAGAAAAIQQARPRAPLTPPTPPPFVAAAPAEATSPPRARPTTAPAVATCPPLTPYGPIPDRVPPRRAAVPVGRMPPRGWLAFGALAGEPVWINLAATGGIGLDGPAATDAARTLLAALLTTAPATSIVTDQHTAAALLGTPTDHTPAGNAAGDTTGPNGGARWRVLPDPTAVLAHAHATLRDGIPRRYGVGSPMVLGLPAPTGSWQRAALAALLRHRPTAVVAIIGGVWPPGWNCHIDRHGRITRHTPPDPRQPAPPSRPAYLAGATVTATPAAHLRDLVADPTTTTSEAHAVPDTLDPAPGSGDATQAPTERRGADDGADGPPRDGADRLRPQPATPVPAAAPVPPAADSAGGEPTGARWRTTVPPLRLSILGPTALHHFRATDIAAEEMAVAVTGIGPRAVELLVYLAAHPDGVHRHTLVAALWPDTGPDRPTNALNSTLTRLRKTLDQRQPGFAGLVARAGDRYRLDDDLVSVDYWDFLVAATDLTHPDPTRRRSACEAVLTTYQGPLAVEHPGEWLITMREATRRRYLDALTTLARLTIGDDPERTLGLLETARNLEPLNEAIYRDIIRIQLRLARPDAAALTLQLLRAQLADIDAAPDPATTALLNP